MHVLNGKPCLRPVCPGRSCLLVGIGAYLFSLPLLHILNCIWRKYNTPLVIAGRQGRTPLVCTCSCLIRLSGAQDLGNSCGHSAHILTGCPWHDTCKQRKKRGLLICSCCPAKQWCRQLREHPLCVGSKVDEYPGEGVGYSNVLLKQQFTQHHLFIHSQITIRILLWWSRYTSKY